MTESRKAPYSVHFSLKDFNIPEGVKIVDNVKTVRFTENFLLAKLVLLCLLFIIICFVVRVIPVCGAQFLNNVGVLENTTAKVISYDNTVTHKKIAHKPSSSGTVTENKIKLTWEFLDKNNKRITYTTSSKQDAHTSGFSFSEFLKSPSSYLTEFVFDSQSTNNQVYYSSWNSNYFFTPVDNLKWLEFWGALLLLGGVLRCFYTSSNMNLLELFVRKNFSIKSSAIKNIKNIQNLKFVGFIAEEKKDYKILGIFKIKNMLLIRSVWYGRMNNVEDSDLIFISDYKYLRVKNLTKDSSCLEDVELDVDLKNSKVEGVLIEAANGYFIVDIASLNNFTHKLGKDNNLKNLVKYVDYSNDDFNKNSNN